jgi:GYF domain 2
MDAVWYYARDGAQMGPVSFDELKAAAAGGKLSRNDLVWKDGTPDWVPAATVPGLFAGPSPPPAPAAPSAAPTPPPSAAVPAAAARAPEAPLHDKWGAPPGESAVPDDIPSLAKEFIRRTVAPNPSAIGPTATESERLSAAGVLDPTARKFAVWRRAVLWVSVVPTAFAALFGLINVIDMEKSLKDMLSGFGIILFYLQALSLFALPATAVLAALAYDRLPHSTRLVLLGGLVSFGVPILIAFVPADVLGDPKTDPREAVGAAEGRRTALGFAFGIYFYLILTPLVLSLLPAVSRACVRVKTFLPESLAPGWGLVASIPLFVLLTLTVFVVFYQFFGNFLLIIGLLLWIGAPLLYLSKFRLLTRPVTESPDLAALARTQLMVVATIAAGMLLLVVYLFTAKVGGMTIVGTEKEKSLIRPWSLDLHAKWIEYIGRSLFLTVLFADLLVRMALSVWREERAFGATEKAATFDRTMSGVGAAVEAKATPPVA